MHRLKSKSLIHRFRLAAFLLCAKWMLVPVTGGVLIQSTITSNHQLTIIGIGLIALTALTTILQWLVASRTGCPLCMTPVLAAKKCATNRRARSFLGSHRLRVALAVLFRNSFRCPYCHEPTILEVRGRNRPK